MEISEVLNNHVPCIVGRIALQPYPEYSGVYDVTPERDMVLNTKNKTLREDIIIHTTMHEEYQGSYMLTPKDESQTFETEGKFMTNDIVVSPIPYKEEENESGTTIVIGGE